MRILMLTNAMESGGAETHVLALSRLLSERGHRVTVASAGGAMVKQLTVAGIPHVCLPLDRRGLFSLFRAHRGLSRLLRKGAWDVVHAHARLPAFLAAPLCARRGLCLVSTVHAKFSVGRFSRRYTRFGQAAVAVCESLRGHVCAHFPLDASDVTVIENGVDVARFSPKEGRAYTGHHVLFMSRLDGDCARGALLLCRLAPRLARRFPDLRLTVIGGGDAYVSVAREVSRAAACGVSIRLAGRVEDPAPLLRECDVFVGVGRGAMEAMACGVSVILGGDEGFWGLLDESSSAFAAEDNFCARGGQEMTEARLYAALCEALAQGADERAAQGAAMRRYAVAHLSAERMAARTEAFYRRVLARQMRGGGEVLLCGYYGFGNTGDEALLRAGVLRARERFGAAGISVLMKGRRMRDGLTFGLCAVSRRRPWEVVRAAHRARVLVFGGGTLLQDLTSRRSLWYYASLLLLARRWGAVCELWGNGLGPLLGRGSEERAAAALRACRTVGLRDGLSLSLGRSLLGGRADRVCYEPDLALGTSPSEPARRDYLWRSLGLSSEERYVLVAPKKSGTGIAALLDVALRQEVARGARLLFVALYPREDAAIARRLCERFGGILWPPPYSPSDLVAVAARCERVIGMRLHALVFAASAHTPFTAIGTDPKLTAFEG